jgi:hypothetical protein
VCRRKDLSDRPDGRLIVAGFGLDADMDIDIDFDVGYCYLDIGIGQCQV